MDNATKQAHKLADILFDKWIYTNKYKMRHAIIDAFKAGIKYARKTKKEKSK